MDISKRKTELRSLARTLRDEVSQDEWRDKSNRIKELFLSSDLFSNAERIHSYVSMNERKEVDTLGIIEHILVSEKSLCVPVTDFNDISMRHFEIDSLDDFKMNEWGIKEPGKEGQERTADQFDLIIVPLLASDIGGNRLGYGKGFYDRFLKKTRAIKVGLVFDNFIFSEIPTDEHDQSLDYLITEKSVIKTKH
ncbi:5-formyltetrahydrofolate cyclo-ligase [Balneola sp. MJW-20]|uniref:5-formyltetrahydrofolate cyclo-ligase n=1 Tax=Gracilimonas aurantiaca TaxID=3234185 RepID=UPI003467EBAD